MLTIKVSDTDERETFVRFDTATWAEACDALGRARELCPGHRLVHARVSNQQGRARCDVTLVYLRVDRHAQPVGSGIPFN